MRRTLLPALLAFAALAALPPVLPAATPRSLHVAWLDGRDLADAMAAAGPVLDRYPDAAIVEGTAAALGLRRAGFRVEGPITLAPGRVITLIHEDGHHTDEVLDPAALEAAGGTVVWRGGRNWIVASDVPLPESAALLVHHRKALRRRPLAHRDPVAARAPAPALDATDFAPIVEEMVDQVSGAQFMDDIGRLAGRVAVSVGGTPATFVTRASHTALCDKAEQYVYERFQAMGYSDVAYDPFTFGSTSARNVVATLPGVETPHRIVIIGGHLDSTSPQSATLAPGANDNASGVAGVLQAAQILRNYSFRNTVKFIAFTGEEQGLHGSQHYADAAAARGDSIVAVVIYDMIGWKDAIHGIDIEGETAWLPLMNVMSDACARYTSIAPTLVLNSWGSDHVPFQDNGFPAFLAIEKEYPDYPCYHQTCDTTGWNQPDFGAETIRAGLATVAHMAGPRAFYFTHTALPATTENTAGPYEVSVNLSTLGPLLPDSLLLHWSRGGPELTEVMTPAGPPGVYRAFIPGQPAGTTVRYWMSARDTEGRLAVHPEGAPVTTHQFLVAGRVTLFYDGFEAGGPGWTSGGTGNDWQIGPPQGLAQDPSAAYAGLNVAGNDLTGLGANPGRYEPLCDNWFESPPVDCSNATEVRLAFMRRIAVDRSNGGSWDAARVLVNGTLVWANPAQSALIENVWNAQEINVANMADGHPAVRVRFAMRSNATVHYGGWNLDEIRLTGYSTVPTTAVAGGDGRGAALLASAPNPGRPGTTIAFELPSRQAITLAIYDVRGRRVRTLAAGDFAAGRHGLYWNGRGDAGEEAAAGIYFARLTTTTERHTRKLALVR